MTERRVCRFATRAPVCPRRARRVCRAARARPVVQQGEPGARPTRERARQGLPTPAPVPGQALPTLGPKAPATMAQRVARAAVVPPTRVPARRSAERLGRARLREAQQARPRSGRPGRLVREAAAPVCPRSGPEQALRAAVAADRRALPKRAPVGPRPRAALPTWPVQGGRRAAPRPNREERAAGRPWSARRGSPAEKRELAAPRWRPRRPSAWRARRGERAAPLSSCACGGSSDTEWRRPEPPLQG